MGNIYFELTEAFNAEQPTVALASGQAVVFHRIAIMSKDGDWIVRETPDACERVLAELERRGARYRAGAPLDVRWLAGGWSSHFEFFDEHRRRIRCDFLSRPPRVPAKSLSSLFAGRHAESRLLVIDLETLILMKRTQRAKDYAVIGELARRLPPEREIELTTDPDRVIDLAPVVGHSSTRPAVRAARAGADRRAVVLALAEEADTFQQEDRRRLSLYAKAAQPFLQAWQRHPVDDMPLPRAHTHICELATGLLPVDPLGASGHANAQ